MGDNKNTTGRTVLQGSPPPTTTRADPDASAPPVAENLPGVGDIVDGKYRVVSLLGEGGMGLVYKARDERLEREVAFKVIRPSWSNHGGIQEVFLSEARAMARVSHPNVIEIYDFGWTGASPYFVMQFVEGVDLEHWMIEKTGLLAIDEALGLLDNICRGVEAIHNSGAVHRDLKPSNVIVGRGFQVAVADLGLAQVLSAATGKGMRVGSPGFMAPEMIQASAIDPDLMNRVDIYALGAIAYELLTSTPAFDGESVDELLDAQSSGEFKAATELRPELPAAFDAVISRAMALDPAQRQSSVSEFRRQMHAARHEVLAKPKGRRVMVIDDSAVDLKLISRILREGLPDVEVATFIDPHDALQAVDTDPPALIVTDLRMDRMDGSQLVAAIRSAANFNHVPIVVLSANGSSREWKALKAQGADGFLLKPVDPVPLVALVESLLESPMRVRGARPAD